MLQSYAGSFISGMAVAGRVREILHAAPLTPAYAAALAAALALPGNVLSAMPDMRWARLVWTCCTAAGGRREHAVPVAAAVEIFMVALDVLDDAEDGEETPLHATLGAAQTLNVSTGLLLLTQKGLLRVAGGAAAAGILLDAGLRACSGQHADLTLTPAAGCGPNDALSVTAGKSASLTAAICQLGALCADAPGSMQETYARFGWHLGMAAQLANDLAAIRPGATSTDVALGRPTLPLTCAARATPSTERYAPDDHARAALWTGGPAYLTWAVAETYRRRALDLIPQLTGDHANRSALTALLDVL